MYIRVRFNIEKFNNLYSPVSGNSTNFRLPFAFYTSSWENCSNVLIPKLINVHFTGEYSRFPANYVLSKTFTTVYIMNYFLSLTGAAKSGRWMRLYRFKFLVSNFINNQRDSECALTGRGAARTGTAKIFFLIMLWLIVTQYRCKQNDIPPCNFVASSFRCCYRSVGSPELAFILFTFLLIQVFQLSI